MRCLPALLLAFVSLCVSAFAPVPAAVERPGGPRVRPDDTRIARLFADGLRRSPLLAELAARVEAGHVVVYLQMQPNLDRRLAGCLTWLGAGGGYRYVRASFRPSLPADAIIAAIAHELQHVLEIGERPEVASADGLRALYQEIGRGVDDLPALDTVAARQAGAAVRRDLHLGLQARVRDR